MRTGCWKRGRRRGRWCWCRERVAFALGDREALKARTSAASCAFSKWLHEVRGGAQTALPAFPLHGNPLLGPAGRVESRDNRTTPHQGGRSRYIETGPTFPTLDAHSDQPASFASASEHGRFDTVRQTTPGHRDACTTTSQIRAITPSSSACPKARPPRRQHPAARFSANRSGNIRCISRYGSDFRMACRFACSNTRQG